MSLMSVTSSMSNAKNNIMLYHGSAMKVECPNIDMCKPKNDYGVAFYCTPDKSLAEEWAVAKGNKGYCCSYEISLDGLNILDLEEDKYILRWVVITAINRRVELGNSNSRPNKNLQKLLEHFSADLSEYDIIIGDRADDRFLSFIKSVLDDNIAIEDMPTIMKYGNLGIQYGLRTKLACDACRLISTEDVDIAKYHKAYTDRIDVAYRQYNNYRVTDVKGTFLTEYLEENYD